MSKYWLSVLFILFLFLFTRLYKLETSFFFFNDMGRDFLVLQDFKQTLKPPLLGPQTSALPFNQSAVYFYLLFPLFVLTRESLFSSHYTLLIFYSVIYLFGAYHLRHQLYLRRILLLSSVFLTILPQLIIQNRFVWNPSFIAPLSLAVTLSMMSLTERFSLKKALFLSTCLSLALALNYSVAPFFLAVLIISVVLFKRKSISIIVLSIVTTILYQLPTIIFELRHQFLLSKALLAGNFLIQERTAVSEKLHDFTYFMFTNIPITTGYLLIISILIIGFIVWAKQSPSLNKKQLLLLLLTTVTTFIFSLIFKTSFQAHYIFALAVLFIMVIAALPLKIYFLYLFCLAFYWLAPNTVQTYFLPAKRSTHDLINCAQIFCNQHHQETFVSVQAGFHPYHNGPEYRYLFGRYGCNIKSIETELQAADYMSLVVDDSTYEHNKTSFNELTLFGPSKVIETVTCLPNLQVILLKKAN